MKLYQAALSAISMSVILSACGGGSGVSESEKLANLTEQETVVSSGTVSSEKGGGVVVAPPATTASTPITTPITTPTKPTPVSSTPVTSYPVTTPTTSTVAQTSEEPAETFGAATMTSASISGDDVVLSWNQTNEAPYSGYDVLIDGSVATELGNVASSSVTINGLDLSEQHCFQVSALYTQFDPVQTYLSNTLCTDAQQEATNQPPVISGNPSGSVDAGGSYAFTPSASDSDDDELTFSVTNLPAWAQFNTQTGRLSGTPTTDDAGDYNNIVITVSDGTDEADLTAFAITVNSGAAAVADTGSISLRWVAPTTRTDGSTLSMSEIQGYCIYVGTTRNNMQMVADINQGDTTDYIVDNLDLGDYYVAVSVYDQDDNMSGYSNVVMKSAVN